MNRTYSVFAVVIVSFFLVAFHSAQAITVSPIRIELNSDPNGTVSSSFKVTNDEAKENTYSIIVARFETKDETGEPVFVPGKEEIPSWVEIANTVTVPGRGSRQVPFSIIVPNDVDPGGYFAGVFVSKSAPGLDANVNIGLQSNVGTLIFLRVNGDFKEGETILEFATRNKQKFFSSLPVSFYYRFQNSGEDRVKPLGDIIIKNLFGFTTKVVNANPSAGSVLPKSIRKFFTTWQTSGGDEVETNSGSIIEPPNDQTYLETLKWQWQHFAFGRYVAHMTVTVENDASRSYSKKTSFWVIPWQLLGTIIISLALILGVLLGLAIIIVLLILRRRDKK